MVAIRYSQARKVERAGVTLDALAPGAQERLLDEVLGVLERTEHAIAVDLELAPVALDGRGETGLQAWIGGLLA